MAKLLLIALVLSFTAASSFAQQLSPPEVKTLLAQVRDKRIAAPDVQADFREEKIMHLMNNPIASSGHVWFEPPNKFRREVKGNSPSVAVSDGAKLWIYYPNFKSAERYTLGSHSPVDAAITAINTALNLENVESSFEVTGVKSGNGYELRLLPKNGSMKRIFREFNIQLNSDLHVTRTEMVQPNGDRVTTTYLNHSRATIPASTFQFAPPAGTEVTAPLSH